MDALASAGTEDSASEIVDAKNPRVDDRAGTFPARCPHTTRVQRPDACSLCVGVAVARIVPVDSIDATVTAAPKPRRGRPRVTATMRERQQRERGARARWARESVLITAPRVAP